VSARFLLSPDESCNAKRAAIRLSGEWLCRTTTSIWKLFKRCEMKRQKTFNIVIASNSQSMPFPWNKRNDADRPDLFTSYWMTYPHVARRILQVKSRPEILLTSLAIRGATIKDAYAHADHIMRWMAPDVTVMNYGIVECWPREGGQTVVVEEFAEKLREVIKTHQSSASPPVLVLLGIANSTRRKNRLLPTLRENIAEYNKVLESAAAPDRNIFFLDMKPIEQELGEKMLSPDAHHFSAEGHEMVGQHLARLIEQRCEIPPAGLVLHTARRFVEAWIA